MPHHRSGEKTSSRNRTSPYTAILSMTPDMRAETGVGLAGWAYGSHLWNGMIPPFMENPIKSERNATIMSGVAGEPAAENENDPVWT